MIKALTWGVLTAFVLAFLTVALMPSWVKVDDGWLWIWIAVLVGFITGTAGSLYLTRRKRLAP